MTPGERIKELRIQQGLSQQELAYRVGVNSRTAVCTVEKNREDLTLERLKRYAAALNVEPSYLMGWDDNTSKNDDIALKFNFNEKDMYFIEQYAKLSENGREKCRERIVELLYLEDKI